MNLRSENTEHEDTHFILSIFLNILFKYIINKEQQLRFVKGNNNIS
jgi:hypothetical protein